MDRHARLARLAYRRRGRMLLAWVAVTAAVMAAAVTLLPALLAFAGQRVNRLHVPGLRRSA